MLVAQTGVNALVSLGFHVWWLQGIQKSGVQHCPLYGRFGADHMFYQDSIPVCFINGGKRSLNRIGKPCFILQPHGAGLDKRMASLSIHAVLCAGKEQPVRIAIIHRNTGERLCKEEQAVYAAVVGLVQVYFQPNAWADGGLMLKHLDQFHSETAHLLFERVLGGDQHAPSLTVAYQAKAEGSIISIEVCCCMYV